MAVFGIDAIKRRLGQGNIGSTYQDPRGATGIAARGSNVYNGGSSSATPQMTNTEGAPAGIHPGNKANWNPTRRLRPPAMNNPGTPPGVHPGNKADWTPNRRFTPGGGSFDENPTPATGLGESAINRFDPQIEAIRRRLQESLAIGSSNRDMARQRVGEDYTLGQSELQKAREAAQRQLQANLASNGILRSGMNLEQMGQIGESYQGSLDELTRNRTRTLEDIDTQWNERQRQAAVQEEMLALEQARINQQAALQQAQQQAQQQAAEESARRQQEAAQQQFINVTPTGQLLPNEQRAREMTGAHGQDQMYYQDANKLTDRINQIFVNDGTQDMLAPGESQAERIARLMDEVAGGRTLDDIRRSSEIMAQRAAKRRIGQ